MKVNSYLFNEGKYQQIFNFLGSRNKTSNHNRTSSFGAQKNHKLYLLKKNLEEDFSFKKNKKRNISSDNRKPFKIKYDDNEVKNSNIKQKLYQALNSINEEINVRIDSKEKFKNPIINLEYFLNKNINKENNINNRINDLNNNVGNFTSFTLGNTQLNSNRDQLTIKNNSKRYNILKENNIENKMEIKELQNDDIKFNLNLNNKNSENNINKFDSEIFNSQKNNVIISQNEQLNIDLNLNNNLINKSPIKSHSSSYQSQYIELNNSKISNISNNNIQLCEKNKNFELNFTNSDLSIINNSIPFKTQIISTQTFENINQEKKINDLHKQILNKNQSRKKFIHNLDKNNLKLNVDSGVSNENHNYIINLKKKDINQIKDNIFSPKEKNSNNLNQEIDLLKTINIKQILSYYQQKLIEKEQLKKDIKNISRFSLSDTSEEINTQIILGQNKQLNEENIKLKNEIKELKNKKNQLIKKYSEDIKFFIEIINKINFNKNI